MNNFKSLFTFDGRIGRQDFLIVQVGLMFCQFIAMTIISMANDLSSSILGILSLISIPFFLVLFWISLAAMIKRWHDVDKSGFWCFITLVPIVGVFYAVFKNFFVKGTDGSNRFGKDPLTETQAPPASLPPL